ncbi:hypothetical protein OAX11_01240 [Flavobacteriaceae bacterium]|nr:hypothetical protein [Flavobacteriaceae bacterium]
MIQLKRRMLKLFSLVIFIFLSSCSNKNNIESEVYIGAYENINQMITYPYIIQQKKDSIYLFNNKGILIDKANNNKIIDNKTIKFKENHFKIHSKKSDCFYTYDIIDTLKSKSIDVLKFIQVKPKKDIDVEALKNELENNLWKYNTAVDKSSTPNKDLKIEQTIQFKRDSLTCLTEYFYQKLKTVSEYETKGYKLFKIDGVCFLSFQKEKDNPQTIYQIINFNTNEVKLKDFSSRNEKDISFYKVAIKNNDYKRSIEEANYYSNCFDGYQGEYYYEDITYNKGNEYILNYVTIDAPKKDDKSGYIIIHFNINCNSTVGNFGLIQMDRSFKKTSFSKEMIKHLINKVSTLHDFPSINSQIDWLNYKDVHAFLMFKLQNGKIVDLCP